MSDKRDASAEWKIANVIEVLRKQARPNQPPTAQIFLDDSVEIDRVSMEELVQKIVEDAVLGLRGPMIGPQLGKLRYLAKSFSVTADPDVIAEIAKSPSVRSILPSKIDDIYPKPLDTK